MGNKDRREPERFANTYSEPELLLALNAVASSGAEFSNAVEQIERLLVEAGVCIGLLILEVRHNASFPIAGTGGPVPRRLLHSVVSKSVRAGTRNVQLLFLPKRGSTGQLTRLADFVAEQVSELLLRDYLPDWTRITQSSIARRIVAAYPDEPEDSASTRKLA